MSEDFWTGLFLLPYKLFNQIYLWQFPTYKRLYFWYKSTVESSEIALLKKIIKPGMTVVDVGANIGFHTLLMSDLVGKQGTVYAFEPEENNFSKLTQSISKRSNVIARKMAIGDVDQILKLYISPNLNVDHLLYQTGNRNRGVKVSCRKLDTLFPKVTPDLIKVDTQGFESQVLKGAKGIISRAKSIYWLSEFSAYDLQKAGSSAQEYLLALREFGLKTSFQESDGLTEVKRVSLNRSRVFHLIAKKLDSKLSKGKGGHLYQ
jgi:FkbM family methyltransferase